MPLLSLRLVISLVSAFSVILVATVTLVITLVSGFSALRGLARSHVQVLQADARRQTEGFFQTKILCTEGIANFSQTANWSLPAADQATFDAMGYALHMGWMNSHASQLYMTASDGSSFAFEETFSPDIYSHRRGQVSQSFPNTTAVTNMTPYNLTETLTTTYFRATGGNVHNPVSAADLPAVVIENPNPLPLNPRFSVQWATFLGGSQNGNTPLMIANPTYSGLNPKLALGIGQAIVRAGAPPIGQRTALDVYGFVFTAFFFDTISTFLVAAKVTPNTVAFIYDQSGHMLGSSEPAPFVEESSTSGSGCSNTADFFPSRPQVFLCQVSVRRYPNSLLNGLATQNDLLYPEEPVVRHTELVSGELVFVASSQVPLNAIGLQIFIALMLPEQDLIGDIVRGRDVSIGVTCALVVVLAALNAVVVMVALTPLQRIAERMVKAANLEDDGQPESLSAMEEVFALQSAYTEMNEELNRIRSYVPQAVLYARAAAAEEDEEGDIEIAEESKANPPMEGRAGSSGSRHTSASVSRRRGSRGSVSGHTASAKHAASRASSGSTPLMAAYQRLAARGVTLVSWNIEGFHGALAKGHSAAVTALGSVVEQAEVAVAERRGVLSFHGDRLTATLNATRPCASHAQAGVTCAMGLPAMVEGLRLRCGVATGPCVVGSTGSANTKTVSVMGRPFTHAVQLERLTRAYGPECSVLVSQQTVGEAQGQVALSMVDVVAFRWNAAERRALLVATPKPQTPGATNVGARSAADVEWLYAVNQAATPRDALLQSLQEGLVPASSVRLEAEADLLEAYGSPVHKSVDGNDPLIALLRRAQTEVAEGRTTEVDGERYQLSGGALAIATVVPTI